MEQNIIVDSPGKFLIMHAQSYKKPALKIGDKIIYDHESHKQSVSSADLFEDEIASFYDFRIISPNNCDEAVRIYEIVGIKPESEWVLRPDNEYFTPPSNR